MRTKQNCKTCRLLAHIKGLWRKCSRHLQPPLARGGNLLGHAVDGAEAKDEIAAVNARYFTPGKVLGDDIERDAIVGIVKNRNKDEFIGNVKVCVAGGQAKALEINWRWHGKLFDTKRLAVLILTFLQ